MSTTERPPTPRRPGDRFNGRKIRCGAIGVGRMGRHHARVYATLPDCELVGVVDADKDRGEAVAAKADAPPDAMYVAGGTDLYPNMKRRHQEPVWRR